MAQKKLDTFNMETRFDGLIKLLAEGLYSEKDIFVRELIQNAHDSIIRRKELEPDLAGRIDIDYDTARQTISFTDNGIGMDEQDIRLFLSVIGSTGTGTARESGMRLSHELIGQFGIGMLSAFVVADKVYVDTLKNGMDTAFEWRNSGSEECQLYSSDRVIPGSRITVFLRADFAYFLSDKKLREIIIRYCDFISVPIYLNGAGPVNTVDVPWNREYASKEAEHAAYSDFINRRFTDYSLDVFPFFIDGAYSAKGILYISDRHVADINTGGLLDIFIRRMLVKQADTALLPTWAKFVRGVIDSPDLKPTAARDNVQTSDKSFEYIRQKLGEVIVKRLTYLAKEHPAQFRTINEWHHYHLKGMAYFYDEFFNAVADLLLFETNRGMMSLKDYLPKNEPQPDGRAPLFFFAYHSSAAQYYRMADAKNLTVINAGDRFDEEVLNKYAENFSNKVVLKQFDVLSDGILFEPLPEERVKRYANLEQKFVFVLNRNGLNVQVEAKRFLPAVVPAVIVESTRTKAEENLRALLSDPHVRMGMEDVWSEVIQDQQKKLRKLALNAGNPVIEGLLMVKDERLLEQMLLVVYNNAMMYSHRMQEEDMNIVHDSMVGLMNTTISLYHEREDIQEKLEENRRRDIEDRTESNLPDHIRVFMITPFADEFRPVEQAVRNVLEGPPFFFEVRLARDYTHEGAQLVNDIRQHISESHAFLADITGLNPNVMMELGAIFMRLDPRPVLVLRSETDSGKVPADIGDKLRISYGSPMDDIQQIETDIRAKLEMDGKIIHGDIEELMRQRRTRYLSTTLLRSLPLALSASNIANIRKQYGTVDALLTADFEEMRKKISLKPYLLQGLKDELEAMLDNG